MHPAMNHVLQTRTAVAPPPSLDDILGAADSARIGRVDFTHRLAQDPPRAPAPEPEPSPEITPVPPEPEPGDPSPSPSRTRIR